jgi:cytochrome-b5 reductase
MQGLTGHVDANMITSFLPPPKQAAGPTRVLVCGPPGFMKHLSGEKKSPSDQGELTGLLAGLHYTKEEVYKY